MDKREVSPAEDPEDQPVDKTAVRSRTLPLWVPEGLHRGARWALSLGGRLFPVEEEAKREGEE